MRRLIGAAAVMAALVLPGCSTLGELFDEGREPGPARETARAFLRDTQGRDAGNARLVSTPNGVIVHAQLRNVSAGEHAFHLHAVGECEPPDFTSAGGHLNPYGRSHGMLNVAGPHAGDLPNVHVPPGGDLEVEAFAEGVTFGQLFDGDGSAVVLHTGPDDYATDPAGAAGSRIVCGVIER